MSRIKVTVNGREFDWKRIMARKSLDEICHYAEVEIPASERSYAHKHDRMQIRFSNAYLTDNGGERPVTTVLIDEIATDTDSENKNVTLIGRSPARDIIDSTWSDTITGSPDLLEVTKKIASKFGITVYHMPQTINNTKSVKSFSWENESPWARLLTEADAQGYIITSSQIGDLYVEKAGAMPNELFSMSEKENVRSVNVSENGSEQFHEYIVRCNNLEGKAVDSTCKSNRILTINLSDFDFDQERLERRARTEMLRRRENKVTCNMSGWGLPSMQIKALGDTYHKEVFWEVNSLIKVNLPSFGFVGNMLVSKVEYKADSNNFSCDVTLSNPESYGGDK